MQDILAKAKKEKRSVLTEAESKRIIGKYGIPVVHEKIASTPEEAADAAEIFGYPVVLKGLGSRLMHKTERGLVHLNLTCREDILKAAEKIRESAGSDLEGYLVQPMIRGRREFSAGIFRDPQFGPVVMFGLGGVLTEALGDVVFRVAPVSETQADFMLDEFRSSKLLCAFRGESPVERKKIIDILTGLSRLAAECPDISEVDINPLVANEEGELTAVDALVVIGEKNEIKSSRTAVDPRDIFNMFSPQSIAFVGASSEMMKWGYRLFATTAAGDFAGNIYPVNSRAEQIGGRKVYKSILDIPEKLDLAVVTIPASGIFSLMREMKEKGTRYMLLITSGFAETGEEGARLEEELVKAARDADILIIGPNTMGIANPHKKFYCTGISSWPRGGSVGIITQSGNLGTQLMTSADENNIGLSFYCGSGNESMITIEDYLAALEKDEQTAAVMLYIESVKDGRRFLEQAGSLSRRKPVIVLKGGRTNAGNKAASSHTGAMATDIRVFNSMCRQTGLIQARNAMEMIDLSAGFSSLPIPKGNRIAMITLGGGWGVMATDQCIETGLSVPRLTEDIIRGINELLPPFWNHDNPVDLVGEPDIELRTKIVEMLAEWDGCDAVLHLGLVGLQMVLDSFEKAFTRLDPEMGQLFAKNRIQIEQMEIELIQSTIRLMEKYGKPIVGVTLHDTPEQKLVTEIPGSFYKAVSYPSPERAVNVLAGMVQYGNWLRSEGI
jgi:acyl-CoA synthetase (NDP forming)